MEKIILGRIKDGKVQVQRFFKKDLLTWEGKEIEIRKGQGSKTQKQLGYLFGVVLPIVANHTGFTVEETLHVFYERFNKYHKEHGGRVYEFIKTLSGMNLGEVSEFIEKVLGYARSDMGLIIPDSDPEFVYNE